VSDAPLDGKTACITLDLESDWYVDEPGESYYTFEYLPEYVEAMRELDVPVSVFVVGKLLEDRPDVVETIQEELDAEFHLHSYHHDPEMADGFRNDLQRGVEAFESFFGHRPRGYRAPLGKITDEQLAILDEEGFEFDSSVFPSYRPGAYNNLDAPIEPYRPDTAETLTELPVGVIPYLRIPAAQSYLKLAGRPYLKLLDAVDLPDPLIFVSHLHDFFDTEAHEYRDQPIQSIHKRNVHNSIDLLSELVQSLNSMGYRFSTVDDAYRLYETR
jgi:peptidoglycan/xylan/chitin deacetylase (PgdA/CDA1 family)